MRGTSPFRLTPWVRRLIVANAVVFLLEITLFTGPWFADTFAFSPAGALARPWSFLTYMFLHAGFLHLAFNMLMLFFFGPPVEEKMGGVPFLRYYLLCGIGGPALAFGISLFTPVAPFLGASAAVLGVALAFAVYWPNAQIYIFPLPFPVPVRLLIAFLVIMDLAPVAFGVHDGIAHFAHLGGLLFGLLYLRAQATFGRTPERRVEGGPKARVLVHHLSSAARAPAEPPQSVVKEPPREPDAPKEIDRVLDKISRTGIDSLTPAERRFLDDVSRQLRRD